MRKHLCSEHIIIKSNQQLIYCASYN